MATLYLHIGMPKTGTTTIQLFCEKNNDILMQKGYCFMKSPFFYPNIAGERNGHFLIQHPRKADGSFETARGEREWRKGMDALSRQFQSTPNVILSDEALWSFGAASMWRALKAEAQQRGFGVRVIAYLRRQDQFLESNWAQRIKIPFDDARSMKFEEMLAEADKWMRLDYYEVLEEIAAAIGREAIAVRVYDRQRFPDGDIVKDFLAALGLQPDGKFKTIKDRNSSLSGNALEIKRVINGLPDIEPSQEQAIERIARACFATGDEEKRSMFSQEQCEALLAKYEDSNRRVARDYLCDEGAPLFPPPEALPPQWSADNPEMYEAIVRFFAIALFAPPKERLRLKIRRKLRRLRCRLWELRERMLNGR